jgi:hypothetical protein
MDSMRDWNVRWNIWYFESDATDYSSPVRSSTLPFWFTVIDVSKQRNSLHLDGWTLRNEHKINVIKNASINCNSHTAI